MNAQEFSIVLALARCAMANPTDAIRHQIQRLVDLQTKQDESKQAEYLAGVLREESTYIGKIERSTFDDMLDYVENVLNPLEL